MTAGWVRTVAPTIEPVAIEELKSTLRTSASEHGDDLELGAAIAAAREHLEAYMARAVMLQTWKLARAAWDRVIYLPRAMPAASVAVQYYDTAGTLQTLSSAAYYVNTYSVPTSLEAASGYSWPAVAPRPDAILITYTAGASSRYAVPAPIVRAVKVLAAAAWVNPEAEGGHEAAHAAAYALCAPYRVSRSW